MDKMNENKSSREELLSKIRELEFAAVDLNLYLDNNPRNIKAVEDYNRISEELIKLKKLYEMEYGVLTNFGYSQSRCPWSWVEDPWPWESGE